MKDRLYSQPEILVCIKKASSLTINNDGLTFPIGDGDAGADGDADADADGDADADQFISLTVASTASWLLKLFPVEFDFR